MLWEQGTPAARNDKDNKGLTGSRGVGKNRESSSSSQESNIKNVDKFQIKWFFGIQFQEENDRVCPTRENELRLSSGAHLKKFQSKSCHYVGMRQNQWIIDFF